MRALNRRKNWWDERFSSGGSFSEQATLLLQDFGLVSIMLVSAGGLDLLLQFTSFAEWGKRAIGLILSFVTVAVVSLFAAELTLLCFHTVRRAIMREADGLRRDEKARSYRADMPPSAEWNSALEAFRQDSVDEVEASRKEIESGKFTRDVAEMPKAFETLGAAHSRFDATSCRELAFWHTGGDTFAEEYFGRCSALVGEGKTVTRVFLMSREEFRQGTDLLINVLIRHMRAGIGFAIIPYDELPPRLRKVELDFGLWDLSAAYSRFPHHGDWNRTLYTEFAMNGKNAGVAEKVNIYKVLLSYIWLADERFLIAHAGWLQDVQQSLQRTALHLARRAGSPISTNGIPYLSVNAEPELRPVVQRLFDVWRKIQDVAFDVSCSDPSATVDSNLREVSMAKEKS